ncbi:hypothetical protein PT974_07534 [Cladobotryum mycophilum]|uniref:Nephrocystin 3-like N-terminal domain-containing protein n=1 Tax=Cladobotryum mycophilum TaxID=491253 RepID=A0ABR0SPS2_9HYPO
MPVLSGSRPSAAASQAGDGSRQFDSSQTNPEDYFLQVLIGEHNGTRAKMVAPESVTCSWILQDSQFSAWKTSSGVCPLWIHGNPGCGKSVMSSFILKSRQKWAPQPEKTCSSTENPKKTIVAGCFRDEDPIPSDFYWILRILLHEIFKSDRELLSHVMSAPEFWHGFDAPHPILNEEVVESVDILASLLGKIAADPGISGLYLIVDDQYQGGRDATNLGDLINRVSSHYTESSSPRWIISTRPNGFNRVMDKTYVVDLGSKNGPDITKVAASRMESLRKGNSAITESVRDSDPTECSCGSRWPWIVWDIKTIDEVLQNIPYNVQAIYGQAFENADPKAQSMMRWVFVAGRPLKVSEIQIMLAINDGAKSSEEIRQRAPRAKTLRISMDNSGKSLLSLHEDDTIHLSHPSVIDFMSRCLTDAQQQQPPGAGSNGIAKADVHKNIAEICLVYPRLEEISNLQAPDPPIDETEIIDQTRRAQVVEEYLGGHDFLEYSIKYLGLHLRKSKTEDVNIKGSNDFFGNDSAALRNWVKGYDLLVRCTHGKYTGASSSISLLFISARLNLTVLAKRSISSTNPALACRPSLKPANMLSGNILDTFDKKGWRALHIAADSESEDVVKWLLEQGAEVDGQRMGSVHPGRTALHLAASKSSDTAVRIV